MMFQLMHSFMPLNNSVRELKYMNMTSFLRICTIFLAFLLVYDFFSPFSSQSNKFEIY
jgi:hypothetical protein